MIQTQTKQTVNQYFKTITTIWIALFTGISMTLILFFYLRLNDGMLGTGGDTVFLVLPVIVAVSTFFISRVLFAKQVGEAAKIEDLRGKLDLYTRANVISYAVLEGGILFTLVFFFNTGNYYLAGLALIMMTYFLMLKPSPEKTAGDLVLEGEDRLKLQNKNEVIG